MKHTVQLGNGKSKVVDIPDQWLAAQRSNLGITMREAIDLWLFDHDYIFNEEAEKLTAKAGNGGMRVQGEKKPRKAPTRKPDEIKRAVIAALGEFIAQQEGVKDVSVTNIERVIAFAIGEDNYELTLSKKRKPKD